VHTADFIVCHAPYNKLVRKAVARMVLAALAAASPSASANASATATRTGIQRLQEAA
jgi:hypothetical protein